MTASSRKTRCALYTRKSTQEGLEQHFNSLDAQREACDAFVRSQVHEGWAPIETHYDDGGFSAGTTARPALRRLLADIVAGKIDAVVVYKIDRLTRSLVDFVRMMDLFDIHKVTFVSVTQSFNTTTSMGRLMLNVLLSFAQFERELTGERIREKVAASKARGLWLGGMPPLGYDPPRDGSRILAINPDEAATVRLIFRKYLEKQSVYRLSAWLNGEGIAPKRWTTVAGKEMGGHVFTNGSLFYLLRNPVYIGKVRHKGVFYDGKHDPIVDCTTFADVQCGLAGRTRRTKAASGASTRAPLAGKLFDAAGEPMSPTHSHGRGGRIYRYYVSNSLQKGGHATNNPGLIQRAPAQGLEAQIAKAVVRLCPSQPDPLKVVRRADFGHGIISLQIDGKLCDGIELRLASGETCASDAARPGHLRISLPLKIRHLRGRTLVELAERRAPQRDHTLINALRRAQSHIRLDAFRLPVCEEVPTSPYERQILPLAFLAPNIQDNILAGLQPPQLTLAKLIANPLPICWEEQRAFIAALSVNL